VPFSKRPPGHDGKAPDGFTVNGWRKVCKGGYVRFSRGRHYHEAFAEWAGLWVFVELSDGWGVNVEVWPYEPWSDRRQLLCCFNENDWNSTDKETATRESRRVPTRSCS
jgi:hypothetical protein